MEAQKVSKKNALVPILGLLGVLLVLFGVYARKIIIIDEDKSLDECATWLFESPHIKSRVEAIQLCQNVISLECLKKAYSSPGVTDRKKAADICKG